MSVIIGRRGTKGVNEIRKGAGAIKMRGQSFVMENYVKIIRAAWAEKRPRFQPVASR